MSEPRPWVPPVAHTDLTAVPGGHVYRDAGTATRWGLWWAHPHTETSDYAWGPYQDRTTAARALALGATS